MRTYEAFWRGMYHGFTEWHGFRPNGEGRIPQEFVASYGMGYILGWLTRYATVILLILLLGDSLTDMIEFNWAIGWLAPVFV